MTVRWERDRARQTGSVEQWKTIQGGREGGSVRQATLENQAASLFPREAVRPALAD